MQNRSKLQSNSTSNLHGSLATKSYVVPKKVQGTDYQFLERQRNPFASRIEKIKNKPKVEAVQQLYIKGLQDQIAYLQMQLKLLQEKQMQKHGQIDQLEQFFKDGIPINQNILAIKNGFKSQKTNLQHRTASLQQQKNERMAVIQALLIKTEIAGREEVEKEKGMRAACKQTVGCHLQLIRKETQLRHKAQREEEVIRELKQENKKLSEQLERISRDKMIRNISVIKNENHKMTKLNLLRQSLREKQEEIEGLSKEYDGLLKQDSQCSHLIHLEELNLQLKKRAIFIERDYDSLKGKLKEKQLELEEKKKLRLHQIQLKLEIKERVDVVKEKIARENQLSNEEIQQYAKDEQVFTLQKIMQENQKLAKYIDHYSKLLSKVQDSVETLLTRKPEAKAEISSYQSEIERLSKQCQQQVVQIRSQLGQKAVLEHHTTVLRQALNTLPEKTEKAEEETQYLREEKQRLKQDIEVKQKQLELIYIIKNINFDETEMAKTSNNNLQEELLSFLKGWQKIQRVR